jgi:ABC-type glycerol-3-phosphate transport system substrate-binding protein
MNHRTLIVAAAAALLLAACGGGGDAAVEVPNPADVVPDSANASAAGMVRWMQALVAEDTEAREPVDAARFAPPKPDDAEPVALR